MEPIAFALQNFPDDWRTVRLKDIALINRLVLPESTDPEYSFEYIDISSVDADGNITRSEPLSFADAPSRARRVVNDGDILISTVRTYLRAIAQVANADSRIASTGLAVITPRPESVNGRFLYWWLRSDPFVEQVVAESEGVSYPAINATEIGRMAVPLPPTRMQQCIATYLDAYSARIESLIAECQRQLRLLAEHAFAAQSRLCMYGIRSGAVVPTGLEWLSHVPDHWRVKPLKFVAQLESGHTPSRTNDALWEDCSIPWISLNDVGAMTQQEFISDTVNLVSEQGLASSSARLLPAGAVVLSRDATVGRSSIMAVDMATSQHFAAWICSSVLRPRFLWLLFTTVMQPYFDSLTDGATIRTIGMADLRAFKVPLPPLAEQDKIVELAEGIRAQTADTSEELVHQIGLLREHKRALIASAVMGKFDLGSAA